MHCTNIGNYANMRMSNFTQEFDFARNVEAHFKHSLLVAFAETQDGERQSNLIIEITLIF